MTKKTTSPARLVALAGIAVATLATSTALAASATFNIGSVGAEPGEIVRVPLTLSTEDVVGAFVFDVESSGHLVDDVDYNGLLFSNGWDGWDTAPAVNANVTAACIFPQDQVSGFDLPLVDLLIEVPADATPGSEIAVSMLNVFVSDYTGVPYDVTVIDGTIVVTSGGCDEDVNGDGSVDFADLVGVLTAWGTCDGCAADTDQDGMVGLSDLLRVLASWGPCS